MVVVASCAAVLATSGPSAAAWAPRYEARISRIGPATRELMTGRSWRPGCPVGFADLRIVRLRFWGFDRRAHTGRMVVHRWYADEMARVFRKLYDVRFPIRRMRLVDRYGADDKRSMAANNTSSFNCRWRAGVCCRWSQHAYGKALDLNPVHNPYVWSGGVSPPAGRNYLDRSHRRRGMVHRRDPVWWAFRAAGWEWGGDWSGEKDYQHFSANGH
ncbi:MAG TPA: M15 family metallopeptidase [Actinomycetota bacterium]|nr:M15 family metallopeptidase [Actinomycetota bacterium]